MLYRANRFQSTNDADVLTINLPNEIFGGRPRGAGLLGIAVPGLSISCVTIPFDMGVLFGLHQTVGTGRNRVRSGCYAYNAGHQRGKTRRAASAAGFIDACEAARLATGAASRNRAVTPNFHYTASAANRAAAS